MKLNSIYLGKRIPPRCHPWRHWIFDQLLEESDFRSLQDRLLRKKMKFLTRAEDPERLQFTPLPDLRLAQLFLSSEFKVFLEKTVGAKLKIHESGAIQLRRMTEDSPSFPPHHDFIDRRSLVMLYYLSPQWKPAKGGNLQLLKTRKAPTENAVTVSPLENRMVLFFSDKKNWHAVTRVQDWTRLLVMAEWIVL